jgi:rare lipoprotein A
MALAVFSRISDTARSHCAGHRIALLVAAAGVLAGCAGPRLPSTGSDGPGDRPVAELLQVPDAEPRVEPIRSGGPNKPYEIAGRRYVPETADVPLHERGLASWYGRKFHGRPTSTGETYDMYAMTAAHPTMPLPSYARVRNPANGREIVVRVNDRGPFHPGRVIDLSYAAAARLDLLRGVAPVEIERLTHDDIRSGGWLRGGEPPAPVMAAAPPMVAVTTAASTVADDRSTDQGPQPLPASTASVITGPTDGEPTRTVAAELPSGPIAGVSAAPAGRGRNDRVLAQGYWMQFGAFRDRAGAERLREQVVQGAQWLTPLLTVFEEQSLHRLQAGPYASREAARFAAERVRETLLLVPLLVERR